MYSTQALAKLFQSTAPSRGARHVLPQNRRNTCVRRNGQRGDSNQQRLRTDDNDRAHGRRRPARWTAADPAA